MRLCSRTEVIDMLNRVSLMAAWRRIWLTMLVHRDAFRSDPTGYAQAIAWRARRLRVRSRNRLAALMGQSPHAYALWKVRVEPAARAKLFDEATTELAHISTILELPGKDGAGPISKMLKSANREDCWFCILGPGDRLAPDALEIYAKAAAASPEAWLIYADDDLLEHDERHTPHFKSSWNPELFAHHDFISRSSVVRATADMIQGLPKDGWVEALVAEALKRGTPVHVPAVLHHRTVRPAPLLPRKPERLPLESAPLVTVIIPTRNNQVLLQTCVEGLRRTDYPDVELIVVDNDTDDPDALKYLDTLASEGAQLLRVGGPFNFSVLNNLAAERAAGELLCFLNNDIEIVDADWLSLMVRHAVRRDLGAIGGRLLYPDGTVQHAGVVTGVGGGAAHAHRFQRESEEGYFLRDRLPQRVSAVTAACLLVSKEKFHAVGGFNERDFAVAFNDVDLCLKLNERGWQSFYEPLAVLIHHESKSRGSDTSTEKRARFAGELQALKRHWNTDRLRDPYHHPHLSPFCEQFRIAL
jgi:O-antigen biosynthesis protein